MTMIRIGIATVFGFFAGAGIGFHKGGIDQRPLLEQKSSVFEKVV
jgi:hypothetical protein